jgi:hypothetical protein
MEVVGMNHEQENIKSHDNKRPLPSLSSSSLTDNTNQSEGDLEAGEHEDKKRKRVH